MCGICGELGRRDRLSASAMAAMTERLRPRGPDSGGIVWQDDGALGHRRLEIIDLSRAARQPMVDPELGLTLVFNGCIYNYRELRETLRGRGYRFFSASDTEVVLKAYHAWGAACVERFNGMFAFAVRERDTDRLVLARDRLGIKPLYYAHTPAGFRFASTLPALIAPGDLDTAIDPVALHQYLTFHSVVAPPRTILAGARKLPPATVMTVSPDGEAHAERYWRPTFTPDPEERRYSAEDWR